MNRCRPFGLLVAVLAGMFLWGIGQAQPVRNDELTLELLERIEQLEAELRQVRGELEVQRHELATLKRERALAVRSAPQVPIVTAVPPGANVNMPSGRVPVAGGQPENSQVPPQATGPASQSSLPMQVATTPNPAATPPAQVAIAPPTPARNEQADFDAALGQLREGHYAEAATGFQQWLGAYPNGNLASEVRYWLGESQYFNRNYEAAKEAFINLGIQHPQSPRLPDALLKLGYIYGEEGDTDRAREVLAKLVQVYPRTQAAILAEQRLKTLP